MKTVNLVLILATFTLAPLAKGAAHELGSLNAELNPRPLSNLQKHIATTNHTMKIAAAIRTAGVACLTGAQLYLPNESYAHKALMITSGCLMVIAEPAARVIAQKWTNQ